ncbi:MAG: transcriptional repressor [Spirochaetaceae bacterium]|nr:transcriptional repressor [Spirochaetaceae bacterium]
MERSSRYQTRQGGMILTYLASLGGSHITAAGIAGHFQTLKSPIGKTTVYRHLERLVESGKVRRYFLEDGESACYQYIPGNSRCEEHFHLKCENCGKLFHVNCDTLETVASHVRKKHRFTINPLKTVFYGTCSRCEGKARSR